MEQLFIVVLQKQPTNVAVEMKPFKTGDEVLGYVADMGRKNENDPRTVRRIFSVDEYGNRTAWEVVFEGRLKLIAVGGLTS